MDFFFFFLKSLQDVQCFGLFIVFIKCVPTISATVCQLSGTERGDGVQMSGETFSKVLFEAIVLPREQITTSLNVSLTWPGLEAWEGFPAFLWLSWQEESHRSLAPLGPGKHSLAPKMLSTQCYFLRLLTDLSVWPSHCCGLSPCNRFFLPPGGAIPAPPVPLPHLAPLRTSPRAHFEVERVIFQQRHSSCPAVTIK